MPLEFSSDYYFLFLEQYYVLHKDFDLNTLRIVNFRVNQGNKTYLYDSEGQTLYYSSKSIRQMCDDLGISHLTIKKCIEKESLYLNFFKLTRTLLVGAKISNLNLQELGSLIAERKRQFLKSSLTLKKGKAGNDKSTPVTRCCFWGNF